MSSESSKISTPVFVRWQRIQRQLIPLLAVLLAGAAAWRLWQEAPRITGVGQVDIETFDVRAPIAGEELDPVNGNGSTLRLLDPIGSGQIIASIKGSDGKTVDVEAPFAGQIVKIHRRAGETVTKGQNLFTIASEHGISITTYLRSNDRANPEPGMAVDVREQKDNAHTYRATVERVGLQYEQIPPAYLRDRKAEEWGLPVVITIPQEAKFKPGELVFIGWLPSSPARGG